MEIIICAVIAALIIGLIIRYLRTGPDGIELIPNLGRLHQQYGQLHQGF